MTIIIVVVVVVIVIIMMKAAPNIMNHRGREVQVVLMASYIMNHRGSEVNVVLITPHIMNCRGSVVQVVLVVPYIMNHGGNVVHVVLINPVGSIPSWHSIHGTAGSTVYSMGRVGIGWPRAQATDRSVDRSMMIPGDVTGSIVHIVGIHGAGVLRGMAATVGMHIGGMRGVSVVTRISHVCHHTRRLQVAADQHLSSGLNNHLPHGGNHHLMVISVGRSPVAAMVTSIVAAHSIVRVAPATIPSTIPAIQRSIAAPTSPASIATIECLRGRKDTSQQQKLEHDVR